MLGYLLKLMPSERAILVSLAEGGKTSRELLSAIAHLRAVGVSNIAAHVSSINKKAREIGSRRLIVSEKRKYILNEFM